MTHYAGIHQQIPLTPSTGAVSRGDIALYVGGGVTRATGAGTGQVVAGVALSDASIADGSTDAPIALEGVFPFAVSPGASFTVGSVAYIDGPQQVHSTATGRTALGRVVRVEPGRVWVKVRGS